MVIAIIAILAALLLPGLAKSKEKAHGIYCVNNLKQLTLGWLMYADDHQNQLPGVTGGAYIGSDTWVSGWLDFDGGNTHNTNTLFLTEARYTQIGPYVKTPGVYKCSADRSSVKIRSVPHARVRSVSMNTWMNYILNVDIGQSRYIIFRRSTDILNPPPAKAWVFIDEREDSINDGLFQTDLINRGGAARIVDYPASYHNRAAGLSFADGHAEIKKWLDPRTTPRVKKGVPLPLGVSSPNNPDVAWIQERSSGPK